MKNEILKKILVAVLIAALLGGGAYILFSGRAHRRALDAAERATDEYRAEALRYSELLREARRRVADIEESYREATERIGRAEGRVAELEGIARSIGESNSSASEYNRRIGDEARRALEEVQRLREGVENSGGDGQ